MPTHASKTARPTGDELQDAIFRRMSTQQRVDSAIAWSSLVGQLARIGAAASAATARAPISALARLHGSRFAHMPSADSEELDVLSTPHMQHCLNSLNRLKLAYAISGSLSSSAWGRPRATLDADIVVSLRAADATRIVAEFPGPDWYCDLESVRNAIETVGEFNILHGNTGTKIDLWVLGKRDADRVRFQRRRPARLFEVDCWMLAPEDTILAKLEWMHGAPSERQESDIRGILAIQGDALDFAYLDEWAQRLGVNDRWRQIRSDAGDSIA